MTMPHSPRLIFLLLAPAAQEGDERSLEKREKDTVSSLCQEVFSADLLNCVARL
jgi:hypothetical protein